MTDPSPLRQRIAAAIHRYDREHSLSRNGMPSRHHLGEADFVLAELRTELGSLDQAEADARLARVASLYEQWVKAGAPPLGVSIARWWDGRLVELHGAIRPAVEEAAPAATEATERPTLRERHRAQWLALTDAEQAARIAALDEDDALTLGAGPDFTSPLAGIEVRDPCPWCEDRPLIPRALMDEHVAAVHPEVKTGGPGISVADAVPDPFGNAGLTGATEDATSPPGP